ncbi:MAG: class I poly(R)-hydroxyalkanoic acid synthase [Alphaproteobacteria bacterium]
MPDKNDPNDMPLPDAAAFSQNLMKVASQSQKLVAEFLERQAADGGGPQDPLNIGDAFMALTQQMLSDPQKLAQAQLSLWQDYLALWQQGAQRMLGQPAENLAEPAAGDRRFKDAAWQENQVFDFIKQSYLLTSRWMMDTVHEVDGLDQKSAKKVDFYTRQFIDAMSPSNFVMTNPEVLRTTLEQNGENLVRGLDHMLEDLERGKGKLAIRMTDMDAFQVGENVATTPGKVVWQTDLMQLIQYTPTTEKVYRRPLVIFPPWINKFYILDLRPDNSFIKWAVDQGLTVFVASWVNPDASLADKGFEDYMHEGVFAALDGIEAATSEKNVNAIGYCLGGTLLAASLAYMKAVGDDRVKAATFFTSLVDFAEPGELEIFIDDEQLRNLEERMDEQGGVLDGSAMATTFNMLRANDLIWSFVINNYLLGKDPFPFDLLYWNSDSTRMPRAMHLYYLRNMYQQNRLSQPGALTFGDVDLDLGNIDIPVYILSTKEDHIAPWKATYVATQLYSGPVQFTLAGSGHIAGVVNPPSAGKYGFWTNKENPPAPDNWFASATQHPGSWWENWKGWIAKQSGRKVAARQPGSEKAPVLEDAPGSYVKVRADA